MSDKCNSLECDNFQNISVIITSKETGQLYRVFLCNECAGEVEAKVEKKARKTLKTFEVMHCGGVEIFEGE